MEKNSATETLFFTWKYSSLCLLNEDNVGGKGEERNEMSEPVPTSR